MDTVVRVASPEQIAESERKQATQKKLASTPPPAFVSPDRSLTVELHFPIEYDGKVYNSVTITRPTIGVWRRHMAEVAEAIKSGGETAADSVPIPYLDIPAEVYENLDFMDGSRVEAAIDGFFARSPLRESPETVEEEPQFDLTSSNGEQSPSS